MNLDEVVRFAPLAINCFTGSLAQLYARNGAPIDEAQLLEAGDGYLYRAGLDEWGMPEYTFAVEEVGLLACQALGADVQRLPFAADWLEQLRTLLQTHPGVVVWVNSAHLDYAPVYRSKPGYLHAVLVTGIHESASHVKIFDSLIVDREPHGCEAWLSIEAFATAICDRVRTETYDHMGHFVVMRPALQPVAFDVRENLLRQARSYRVNKRHRDALQVYRELCLGRFRGPAQPAAIAARRLFDHIVVLYVIPGLSLLGQSLQRAGCDARLQDMSQTLIDHWRALSLLALKFEATHSPQVLARLEQRFALIEALTSTLWLELHQALQDA
ncbi:Butirosin biosynthesis protein H, N-terminal [Pseudomonas helmanticensis]|uniref:Butirosin biosynthesis protein H, N-terminal n=1 Tax=Pseudomonas helmanticensis TaxID=1471381 RepID=A0ACD2U247_9PSED|nr:BtrH N-terminal domain-containing protein [Pseudomonas helmanticensis]SMQ23678.1 Butirosin biosynthesis protein H, N-terminal [Pseudomonas helmanticensis]